MSYPFYLMAIRFLTWLSVFSRGYPFFFKLGQISNFFTLFRIFSSRISFPASDRSGGHGPSERNVAVNSVLQNGKSFGTEAKEKQNLREIEGP